MVNYVRKITAKKSCKYGLNRLFGHVLFLFLLFSSSSVNYRSGILADCSQKLIHQEIGNMNGSFFFFFFFFLGVFFSSVLVDCVFSLCASQPFASSSNSYVYCPFSVRFPVDVCFVYLLAFISSYM